MDRLTPLQLRWALAAFGMTASSFAAECGNHPETIRRALRGNLKGAYLSPRLSAAVRDYFTSRGLVFAELDGKVGVFADPALGVPIRRQSADDGDGSDVDR
ncbi:hypothetical protein [Thalassobaculum litoreum]|uniref:Helix-turn-helix domain-containing protein n=1 Tax=Thalassobaculum litoreum DSM 18839 TaxID=1123362 RepID=A0A8G2BIL3_9PROT|nr:hypothetical protein [Thalassobaculum litoreum]SDF83220.1 hypothetical protein SAMN05660686_02455 [Thalassobaculum litoreum DSM 18839]